MIGFNGGLIGAARETSFNQSVPGVWTPLEQLKAKRASLWPPSAGEDPYFANVSLLLRGNGTNGSTTILDESPSPKTVTAYGNAQISTAQSKYGGSSIAFDGYGDSITCADGPSWTFGSGNFTIEGWIYPTAITNSSAVIACQWGSGGSSGTWIIGLNTTTIYGSFRSSTSLYSGVSATATSTISLNEWQHFAVVRNDTSLAMYLNGTLGNSVTINFAVADAPEPLSIGRQLYVTYRNGESYAGYIDDLRITKGVARYTANFTPPGAL